MRSLTVAVLLGSTASYAVAGPADAPIIGGETTTVGQYPTVVALSVGQGLCTGTLIAPEWVLTAAHCLTPSLIGVANQDAVTKSTRVHFNTINVNTSDGRMITAAMTIPKPGFSINNLGQNDIGLIKLSTPVTDIRPTPVNLDAALAPIGTKVTMVGFGTNKAGSVGVEFDLENRTSVSCSSFGFSDSNLLCFSQSDSKGKCQGDSGGPSFATINGRVTVVGVTSFGDRECAMFGIDTRTDVEKDWLRQHIPNLSKSCDDDSECNGGVCWQSRCIAQPFSEHGIGTECTAASECESASCAMGPDGQRCIETCTPGADDACPSGFDCLETTADSGACWPADDGGCCSGSAGAPSAVFGLGFLALVLRRRRR